jgi:hypothetical protein
MHIPRAEEGKGNMHQWRKYTLTLFLFLSFLPPSSPVRRVPLDFACCYHLTEEGSAVLGRCQGNQPCALLDLIRVGPATKGGCAAQDWAAGIGRLEGAGV